MHAHRVEVLDRADHDAVARGVSHDLHLNLFPTLDGLLYQYFIGWGESEALPRDETELVFVVGDATSRPTKGEAGAYHHGVAEPSRNVNRLVERMGEPGVCDF